MWRDGRNKTMDIMSDTFSSGLCPSSPTPSRRWYCYYTQVTLCFSTTSLYLYRYYYRVIILLLTIIMGRTKWRSGRACWAAFFLFILCNFIIKVRRVISYRNKSDKIRKVMQLVGNRCEIREETFFNVTKGLIFLQNFNIIDF